MKTLQNKFPLRKFQIFRQKNNKKTPLLRLDSPAEVKYQVKTGSWTPEPRICLFKDGGFYSGTNWFWMRREVSWVDIGAVGGWAKSAVR